MEEVEGGKANVSDDNLRPINFFPLSAVDS